MGTSALYCCKNDQDKPTNTFEEEKSQQQSKNTTNDEKQFKQLGYSKLNTYSLKSAKQFNKQYSQKNDFSSSKQKYQSSQQNKEVNVLKDFLQSVQKTKEMVILVQDIMERKSRDLHFDQGKIEDKCGIETNDRLRRLFSKKSGRNPKTPPRRIHTDQLSNHLLIDLNEQQFSQEACSAYIEEESNPSLLFSSDDFFRNYNKSRNLICTEQSNIIIEKDYEAQNINKQRNALSKVKSMQVLSKQKRKSKLLNKQSKFEEQKDDIKQVSKKILNKNSVIDGNSRMKKKKKQKLNKVISAKKTNRTLKTINNDVKNANNNSQLGQSMIGLGQAANNSEDDSMQFGFSMDSGIQPYEKYKSDSSNLLNNKKVIQSLKNSSSKGKLPKKRSFALKAAEKMNTQKNAHIDIQWFVNEGQKLANDYKVIKRIGQGGCGEVFLVMHLATDQIRAMKILSKSSQKIMSSVFHEVKMLQQLDHPNIVRIFEYYQDDENLYIIMEYLKGGSLYERLKVQGRYSERETAYIMKQIFQALSYLSSKNIVHRDVKLENILFVQDESMHVKLIDFGSSVYIDKKLNSTQNRIVTAYYVSPEIIYKQPNIEKCDVWSCGVILFIMLSGFPPFRGKDENEILEKVLKGQVNFDETQWKTVSSRAKMLIKQMLEINVKQRLTIAQAIHSPWIKMLTKIDGQFRIDMKQIAKILKMLEQFYVGSRLRIIVLHFVINYFYFDQQIDKFSKFYSYMDTRHVANMNERDLLKFAQRINKEEDLEIILQQQKKIASKLDFNGSGGISFSNFIIACLDFQKLVTNQKLLKTFTLFDKDNDGIISAKDLQKFLGDKISISQCNSIIEECQNILSNRGQQNENVKLNFSNFKIIVHNQKKNESTITATQQHNSCQEENHFIYGIGGANIAQTGKIMAQNVLGTNQQNNIISYSQIQIPLLGQQSMGINYHTGFIVSPRYKLLKEQNSKNTGNQITTSKKSGSKKKSVNNQNFESQQ